MMHYQTQFNKKSISVRNNVKNSMISNFLHSLDEAIEGRPSSITSIHSFVSGFTIPPSSTSIDKWCVVDQGSAMPCLNLKCEWIKYQTIFHPSKDLWQLPACTDDGVCVLCDMWRRRVLDISQIEVSTRKRIALKELHPKKNQ